MKIIGVLGVMPEDLHRDLESFGLFFEDMAVRDLKVYAGTLGGEVLHYRDNAWMMGDGGLSKLSWEVMNWLRLVLIR